MKFAMAMDESGEQETASYEQTHVAHLKSAAAETLSLFLFS